MYSITSVPTRMSPLSRLGVLVSLSAVLLAAMPRTGLAQASDEACWYAWSNSPAADVCKGVQVSHDGPTCVLSRGACEFYVDVEGEDGVPVATLFSLSNIFHDSSGVGTPEQTQLLTVCFQYRGPASGWEATLFSTWPYSGCGSSGVDAWTALEEGLPHAPSDG